MFRIVAFLLMASMALADEVRYDLTRFVNEGLDANPQIQELKHGAEAKKNQLGKLKSEAILPTFYVTMMVGPAPGLKNELQDGDTVEVYDFSRMGPFWGIEAKFIQPLNLGQYRAGKMAIEADIQQKSFDIENNIHKKDVELQTYYYNYLLAREMIRLATDAQKKVNEAYEKLEEALDDDDPNVSQMDLLNLKAKMHTVKEGVTEANLGMKRVMLAIRFSLNLREEDSFATEDSALTPRSETLPTLEEVRNLTAQHHPELRQLSAGLRARRLQLDLAEAKLAPEFFIMGQVQYVKSWAGNRSVMQKDAFAEDAVNKLDGLIGLGVRYNLNFWKRWENYRSARTDLRALQLKESYATNGLMSQAEEQYYQVVAAKEKMDALKESLRASEGILKGTAMKYDLDKSQTSGLVSAYTQNVTMQKDYYFAVCKYNVEFAQLIAKMGMSLNDFHTIYMNQ